MYFKTYSARKNTCVHTVLNTLSILSFLAFWDHRFLNYIWMLVSLTWYVLAFLGSACPLLVVGYHSTLKSRLVSVIMLPICRSGEWGKKKLKNSFTGNQSPIHKLYHAFAESWPSLLPLAPVFWSTTPGECWVRVDDTIEWLMSGLKFMSTQKQDRESSFITRCENRRKMFVFHNLTPKLWVSVAFFLQIKTLLRPASKIDIGRSVPGCCCSNCLTLCRRCH